ALIALPVIDEIGWVEADLANDFLQYVQYLRGDVGHRVGIGDYERRRTHGFMNSERLKLMPDFVTPLSGSSSAISSSIERAKIRLETLASFALLHCTSSGRHGIDIFQPSSVGDFGNASSFTPSCVIASSSN